MSNLATRMLLLLFAALAAGLLAVHLASVSAASAASASSDPLALVRPITHALSGPGAPGGPPTTTSAPTCNAGRQDVGEPQGQDAGEPADQEAGEAQTCGTVAGVDATHQSFVLTTASRPITVVTNAQTEFKDGLASLGDLQTGMTVTVDGVQQADGTVLANEAKGPVDGPEHDADQSDAGND